MKKQLLKFRKIITLIFLIAVFSLGYLVFFDKDVQVASATWWNDSWNYRKSIQVANNAAEETNVYISLTIDTSATSTIQSDCGDLRFTKTNGKVLDYYIVSGCETSNTVIHVNFETFEAGEQSLYYYYGNESAEDGFSSSDFNAEASDYTIGAVGSQETGPGPVGYWSFNEGYGTTAHDESSGGNNGTITGAVWKDESECVSGKCLYFDGIDQTEISTNVQNNMNELTACVWMKANSFTNEDSDSEIILLTKGFYLSFDNNGRLIFERSTSGSYPKVYSSENITINTWYNICGVYYGVGTYPKLFINGIDKSDPYEEGSGIQDDDSSDDLEIGAATGGYEYNFNGYIDEVKIYPYARTADQIKQDYNAGLAGAETSHGASASFGGQSDKWLSDGLVGYWKMDESATTSGAIDSSGNGNNGTYINQASTTSGKFGRGGAFDGDSDYIDIGDTNQAINSISFWLKSASLNESVIDLDGGTHTITISSGDINANGFSKANIFVDGENSTDIDTNWHFVVIKTNTSFVVSNFDIARISSNYFDGQIDEVRIYNRALSPAEVRKLYEWAPGPVMHLKMDEKSGSTVYDTSGNGNDGAISGTIDWDIGKYGSAVLFNDDDSDRITVTQDPSVNNLETLTLSAWLYHKGGTIYYDGIVNKDAEGFFSYYHAGNFWFTAERWDNTSGVWHCPYTDINNKWVNFAVSYDYSSLNNDPVFYINGQKHSAIENQAPVGTIGSESANICIGTRCGANRPFNGKIDDVRIYNYVRTQKQILEDMYNGNPMKGAVLDLSFDEGYGDTAHDASIFGNNGTLHPGTGGTNTATSSMWSLGGKNGGAVELDGSDDYIEIPDFAY